MTASDDAELDRIAAVLGLHQRHTAQHCLCGWGELGKSHPRHQAEQLRAAGVRMPEPVPPRCTDRIGHRRCILDTGHRGGHF